MSEPRVESLFDEFATAYLRGDAPDVRAYLERAGGERDDLGRMLDRFLAAVPAREPTEEEVVAVTARIDQQPPIFALRLRRALSRERVVEVLVAKLGLDPRKTDKVAGYYHELEVGTLDPEPVDRQVWDVLAELLTANVRALAGLPRELPAAPAVAAYYREPTMALEERVAAARPESPEPDEIDRLFRGPEGE